MQSRVIYNTKIQLFTFSPLQPFSQESLHDWKTVDTHALYVGPGVLLQYLSHMLSQSHLVAPLSWQLALQPVTQPFLHLDTSAPLALSQELAAFLLHLEGHLEMQRWMAQDGDPCAGSPTQLTTRATQMAATTAPLRAEARKAIM